LTMIESKERKTVFLREAIRVIGLEEAQVVNERFEDTATNREPSNAADWVTVRAVKVDSGLFETAAQLLSSSGHLLLFRPAHSMTADPPGFTRVDTVKLTDSPPTYLCSYRRVFHVEQSR
jgi:16S rRNA G527 N7-methylase RsmG